MKKSDERSTKSDDYTKCPTCAGLGKVMLTPAGVVIPVPKRIDGAGEACPECGGAGVCLRHPRPTREQVDEGHERLMKDHGDGLTAEHEGMLNEVAEAYVKAMNSVARVWAKWQGKLGSSDPCVSLYARVLGGLLVLHMGKLAENTKTPWGVLAMNAVVGVACNLAGNEETMLLGTTLQDALKELERKCEAAVKGGWLSTKPDKQGMN
jgi:hypothetical protein